MTPDIQSTQDATGTLPFSDNAISSAIGKIMEHPELISIVASALGNGAQSQETSTAEPTKENDSTVEEEASVTVGATPAPHSEDAVATILPMLKKLSSFGDNKSGGRSGFRHEQLLCALKPYVSSGRCQAIDYIIRISQISGLIGKLR